MKRMQELSVRVTWTFVALLASALGAVPMVRGEAPPAKPGDPPEFPKIEEITKEMKVKEGFLTLYHDAKRDRLLARIPMSMMDKRFLTATSIAGGREFAGWMWGDGLVYWQRFDKKLVLNIADPRYAEGKGSTVEDVIGRTYTDPIAASVDIVTQTAEGDPVIDLGELLKSDLAGISDLYGGARVDSSLSRVSEIKSFPHNVELTVDLALVGAYPGADAERVQIHYSLSDIPDNGYTPRVADDRVGYFMVVNKDWSKSHTEKTVFNRYITRWWLEPEDPTAAVSDVKPERQIVFYIEKTVPTQLRHAVREGILEWNKAFEKAGLRNAIRVVQQTDNDPATKDLDPEDVRYNFIRWIVSGQAYAMGPSRANPFTGQILDADIVFDDAMVRYLVNEYKTLGPRPTAMHPSPDLEAFLAANPQWNPERGRDDLAPDFASGRYGIDADDRPVRLNSKALERFGAHGKSTCEYGIGAVRQLSIAGAVATQAGQRNLPEEFVYQVVKEITAHEVGHTLGLMHNFKASSWKPLSEIQSSHDSEEATIGSVMDYNPSVFAASEMDQGSFVTRTIGPYDYWAIDYGYRPVPKEGNEADLLKGITGRVAEAGLAFAADDDADFFSPDPLVNRFDAGDNPLDYARDRVALFTRLMKDCDTWAVEDGESWNRLRRMFNMLLGEYGFGMHVASRLVGGQYINRDHKADPNGRSPIVIVPVAQQREALKLLGQNILGPDAFSFPTELLNRMGAGRWNHWDSDAMDFMVDFDIHEHVLDVQRWTLFHLMNPITLNRIHDAELKVSADEEALTVAELMTTTRDLVWSELGQNERGGTWTARKPMISSFRRNLQRAWLEWQLDLVLSETLPRLNADARAMATLTLRDLASTLDGVLGKARTALDDSTRAHLDDSKLRIEKALAARYQLSQG